MPRPTPAFRAAAPLFIGALVKRLALALTVLVLPLLDDAVVADALPDEVIDPLVMVVIPEVEEPVAVVNDMPIKVIDVPVVPDDAAVIEVDAEPEAEAEPEPEAEDGTGWLLEVILNCGV